MKNSLGDHCSRELFKVVDLSASRGVAIEQYGVIRGGGFQVVECVARIEAQLNSSIVKSTATGMQPLGITIAPAEWPQGPLQANHGHQIALTAFNRPDLSMSLRLPSQFGHQRFRSELEVSGLSSLCSHKIPTPLNF